MSEIIDIYNANLEPEGHMDRVEAHLAGKWHKTFHCWVVSSREGGSILFQLRSAEMVNFPNMLDVSAAGHLESGESVQDGVREVSEELGVEIPWSAFHSLGYRVEVADQTNGQKNREYQAVFLVRLDKELREYEPQLEEITGLVWLRIQDAFRLFTGESATVEVEGIRYHSDQGAWEDIAKSVTLKDFLPRIQPYYLCASIMGERLLEGRRPLAMS